MVKIRAILDVMMARQLVLAMIVVPIALAGGCGKTLNPAYCDEHPNDPDCRNSGLVAIDAPMGECSQSAQCVGNPNGSVCDVLSQTCVQCIVGVDVTGCSGATPQCGDDHACHGCIFDAHCTVSNVCLPNGMCADETTVLYAAQNGAGDVCTQAAPCSFTSALAGVTATKHIVKLLPNVVAYSEPPITIGTAQPVQILGASATYQPNAAGDAITVTAPNVEIVGLTIANAAGGGDGIACTGTSILSLRQMKIRNNTGWGVSSNGCTVTVERTRLSGNPLGAMLLVAGKLEIRNNIIDHNGSGTLDTGNVSIQNASGRLVFNTIVENLSKSGGGRIGGVNCSPASGLTMLVSRNIVSTNGGGATFGGTCTGADATLNYTGKLGDIKFADLIEYRLTDTSPTTILRDDPESGPDCMLGAKYIDDYEGQTRPVNYCDRGADEYRP
ncbi:MAG TPA: right-handed parallel beta-helix repeat-containing protein [Kofleriaceae bacterium]